MADNTMNCQPSCYGRFAVRGLAAYSQNCSKAGPAAGGVHILGHRIDAEIVCVGTAAGKVCLGSLGRGSGPAAAAVVQIGDRDSVVDAGHISARDQRGLNRVDRDAGPTDPAGAAQGQRGGKPGVYAVVAAAASTTGAGRTSAAVLGGTVPTAAARTAASTAARRALTPTA